MNSNRFQISSNQNARTKLLPIEINFSFSVVWNSDALRMSPRIFENNSANFKNYSFITHDGEFLISRIPHILGTIAFRCQKQENSRLKNNLNITHPNLYTTKAVVNVKMRSVAIHLLRSRLKIFLTFSHILKSATGNSFSDRYFWHCRPGEIVYP